MKKFLFIVMLGIASAVYLQVAAALGYVSHKEYASMPIKDCNECHKEQGIPLTHDNDWAGKHHQDTNWMGEHRALAGKAGKICAGCHDQSFCLECHTGGGVDVESRKMNYKRDYVPKSHRSDWLELHPLKALDNPQTCTRCHQQKYCADCHSKFRSTDLEFVSHRRQFSDIQLTSAGPNHANFTTAQCQTCHPGGMLSSHNWSGEHAREARRNLQSCQTCHSDGDVCLKCHSARTGLRVSPHPRNWGAISGNMKDRSSGRSCIRCHDTF